MYGVPAEGDFNFINLLSIGIEPDLVCSYLKSFPGLFLHLFQNNAISFNRFSQWFGRQELYILCIPSYMVSYAPSINYSPWFFLYLYKKQGDPYLKSLRRQKARPKSKKLIMFCLKLSEIKVLPQSFTFNSAKSKCRPIFFSYLVLPIIWKGGGRSANTF